MIGTDMLDRVIGADVYDNDGDKIGTASEVFLDDQSGNPEWVTVKTGLFGSKETFVPLRDADLTGNGVRVPVSKAAVKDAPKIDQDGHLSPEEESALYRHYSVSGTTDTTQHVATDTTTTTTDTTSNTSGFAGTAGNAGAAGNAGTAGFQERNQHGTVGHDTSGPTTDDAMTLSEERLNVGTQRVEAGRARLRKYVVTEQQNVTVPVQREEVRLEREPITDTNVDNALEGPAISEEEHEVVLHAERPVVTTEAVPVERVRLETDTVVEEQTVTGDVRKEQIELEQDGTTTTYGTTTTDR
jgi:uncharacterized protein (TIGR02271 family)